MKPSSPAGWSARSRRAGRARANCSMKRPLKAGLSPRAASHPPLATRGVRLRQICLGGMPAWVPSLLGGVRLQHGRSIGRGAGGLQVELRHRRGRRNRDRDAAAGGGVRGGQGDEGAPGRGGVAAEDAPGRGDGGRGGGGGDRALAGVDHVDDNTEYGIMEVGHPVLFDIDRWIGRIDKNDLPGGKDEPLLYLPYVSEKGEPDNADAEDTAVSSLEIELAETYSLMLDTYVEINKCVAEKWKAKTNLEKLPWSAVKERVREIDIEVKQLVGNYKYLEKQSATLMKQMTCPRNLFNPHPS